MDFRQDKLSSIGLVRHNRHGKLVSMQHVDFERWTITFQRSTGKQRVYELRRDVPRNELGLRLGKRLQ